MRISELAQTTDESPRTIRFYESLGLLAVPARTSAGYRDYDTDAIRQIRFVRNLQTAGLSLAEIRGISDLAATEDAIEAHDAALLASARARVEERLETLTHMRSLLASIACDTAPSGRPDHSSSTLGVPPSLPSGQSKR